MSKSLVSGREIQNQMEHRHHGVKTLQPIPTLCYVIEQRERPSISPTYHYQASMLWTGKKSRLMRLVQKTKLMERLGGLVFLFGIPLCLVGCVLMIVYYTNTTTKESGELNVFSLIGPVLMVLAFLSFILGCLLDGQYKESRLPTIAPLHSARHFQNGVNTTKDVSHFREQEDDCRLQGNALSQSKQKNSSVNPKNEDNNLNSNSIKSASPEKPTSSVVEGKGSTHLKGILKKPSNWRATLHPEQAIKTVDFALVSDDVVDDDQPNNDVSNPGEKSVTIFGPGPILRAASVLLWAVSEKIKLFDLSTRLQTFWRHSKIKTLRQVPINI